MSQVTVAARSSACPEGVHDLFFFPGDRPGGRERLRSELGRLRDEASVTRNSHASPLVTRAPRSRSTMASSPTRTMRKSLPKASSSYAASPPKTRSTATAAARHARAANTDALAHVRQSARGFFHPVGTCAIGRVVDGTGCVSGLDNLYVSDASIMPTIPGSTPTSPRSRWRSASRTASATERHPSAASTAELCRAARWRSERLPRRTARSRCPRGHRTVTDRRATTAPARVTVTVTRPRRPRSLTVDASVKRGAFAWRARRARWPFAVIHHVTRACPGQGRRSGSGHASCRLRA